MPTQGTGASHADDPLLTAFLAGEPEAREQLPRRLRRYLLRVATRFAPKASATYLYNPEDVVQEAFRILLTKAPESFDPGRSSARTYLRWVVRDAARAVRAGFSVPGQKTRSTGGDRRVTSLEHECDEQPALQEALADATQDVALEVENADVIACLVRRVEAPVAAAIQLVCSGGSPNWNAAAEAVGLSRFALKRRLEQGIVALAVAV